MERKLLESLMRIEITFLKWKKINFHGRALLLNRNVGQMTNPSILLKMDQKYQKAFWMHSYLLYVLYMISK